MVKYILLRRKMDLFALFGCSANLAPVTRNQWIYSSKLRSSWTKGNTAFWPAFLACKELCISLLMNLMRISSFLTTFIFELFTPFSIGSEYFGLPQISERRRLFLFPLCCYFRLFSNLRRSLINSSKWQDK